MLRKIILLQIKKFKTKYLLHLAYSSNISPTDCHFLVSCILIGKYFSSNDKFEETFYEYIGAFEWRRFYKEKRWVAAQMEYICRVWEGILWLTKYFSMIF